MVHAVGFGIRYRTPIGPIRVDLAYSINPPSFWASTARRNNCCSAIPTLRACPAFCQPSRQAISHFQFFFSIGQTF